MPMLPEYEYPPEWIPHDKRYNHSDYDNDLRDFLPRVVTIRRERAEDSLGFNIRGGAENTCGIFISKVQVNSEASKQGVKEGDQIVAVNESSFEKIDHAQAVRVLKSATNTHLVIRFAPFVYSQTYERIPTGVPVPKQQPQQQPRQQQPPPQQPRQQQPPPQQPSPQGLQHPPEEQSTAQYQGEPQYPLEPGPPQYQGEPQYQQDEPREQSRSDGQQYYPERMPYQHQQQQQQQQQQQPEEADQYVQYRP